MSKIRFRRPHFKVGYSHNGQLRAFNRIVYEQTNLLNQPFIDYSNSDTYPYDSLPAIWVTLEPFEAFRQHLTPEERGQERHYIVTKYPNWEKDVVAIDMSKYILIDQIYKNKFFLAIDSRASGRSQRARKINEQFVERLSQHDKNYVEVVNKLLGANLSGQFSDRQLVNKLFLARERYWDRTQALIDRFNKLKNE